ncbi:MAG: glycine cleavage system protein GcvH [Gammaproteobacteria bacterium]|nr:glycine cleavage system protein GcvH [Gammaproteobacteria bacterium]NNC97134.1 glycine cleavage system protein GcvH [Gammaproteobacteria bacterium]
MSTVLENYKYTKTHEWVKVEDDGSVLVGITDHAQDALGELVFVEIPDQGINVVAGDAVAVVESVKSASDIYSPVSGEIIASNEELEATPELVNEDAFERGWIFRLQPTDMGEVEELLDASAYQAQLDDEDH